MKILFTMGALVLTCLLLSCSKDIMDMFKGFVQPSNFPPPVYRLADNPESKAVFELGRKLFYEPRFSRDNTVSCGSCHVQSAAFTQHGHDVSHGIDDRLGSRNSTPIMNLAWRENFFWDGGVFDLDLQPIVPITNPVEMDETVDNVIRKLREHADYPRLFREAFGTEEINTARMMKALSRFMITLVSANSKYDKVMRNEGDRFTADEEAGYELFKVKCGTCHKEPLFTDESFRNNGLAIGFNSDSGRYAITLKEEDRYRFKVPSLRNLKYTAPYMHDGRFITLDAVFDHYQSNARATPNVDPLLMMADRPGIAMTTGERTLIMTFLNTLNDEEFVRDRRFSEQ